jgi:hypothetical protein
VAAIPSTRIGSQPPMSAMFTAPCIANPVVNQV